MREAWFVRTIILWLAPLALCIAGCGDPAGDPAGDAQAPPEMPGTPPPDPGESVIVIPMEVNLAAMAAQMEADLPETLAESGYADEPKNVRYRVDRDAIDVTMHGPELTLAIPLRFDAKARASSSSVLKGISAGCRAAATPSFTSHLSVDDGWGLQSTTRAEPLAWSEPCRVMGMDLTDQLNEALTPKLEELAARVDVSIAEKVDLRASVEQAWRGLQEPIEVDAGMWLELRPQRLALAPLDGRDRLLRTELAVVVRPRVVPGKPAPSDRELADNGAMPAERGFRIALEALLDYGTAADELLRAVGDRSFGAAGQTVRLAGARVYGSGDRFVVQVELAGDVKASVYLLGQPRVDAARDELVIDGLEYSVETRNWMLKAADWLMGSGLRDSLAEGARFALGAELEQARARLERTLNEPLGPDLSMKGSVEAVEVQGVYVTPEGFLVIAVATGDLALTLG